MTQSKATKSAKTGNTNQKRKTTNVKARSSGSKTKAAGKKNNPVTQEDIRNRAHEIYIERGMTHGSEQEDWLKAENELNKKAGHK